MSYEDWQIWGRKPTEQERTLVDRATGNLPEMESTKQLVELISSVYQPGQKILDVGCNVGHYLRGIRRVFPDVHYVGVDAYEHYVNKAKEIFSNDPYSSFEIKDIFNPLFPKEPSEIVYCCNVLFHLPDFRKPIENILESTKDVCFIRMLLADYTTIVKLVFSDEYYDDGSPKDYKFMNTWNKDYFVEYIKKLGWNVELISDKFNSNILQTEFQTVKTEKSDKGTRIIAGKQVVDNIICNYTWVKITKL
jgi:SAM-dependent methyltransferase